jgi:hypothetical protein
MVKERFPTVFFGDFIKSGDSSCFNLRGKIPMRMISVFKTVIGQSSIQVIIKWSREISFGWNLSRYLCCKRPLMMTTKRKNHSR